MATAKKLPSGNWRALIYAGTTDGKRRYKSFTAPTKKEAELAAAEWNATKSAALVSDMTLGTAYDRYIASKLNVLSPRTIREYKLARNRDFPELLNVELQDITQERVQNAINEYAKGHSPKSVRNAHGLLSSVLRAYAPDIRLTTTLPKREKFDIVVPTDEKIKVLISAAKGTDIESALILAALGSLRRLEVCAVTAGDIDYKANTVTVSKAMVMDSNGRWVIKAPKSFARYRVITFPMSVMPRIRPVNLNPVQVYRRYKDLLYNAGLPDMRFHDLRHYQASILHALGVPDKYIIQRGGWTTDSTLKAIYQHTMADKEAAFDKLVCGHFDTLLDDKK